jgi:drug/metabolite transporter (DMT)-like permease
MKDVCMRMSMGPAIALVSALLFGLSAPIAKILVGGIDPWVLAGLLYCGAGGGLFVWRALAKTSSEAKLARPDLPWLAGAVLAGGIAGPVLLMTGLARIDAAPASLLLTLEGVFTALLAWFVFRENFDRRIALGMLAIVAGAAALNWAPVDTRIDPWGAGAIMLACLAWAIDNNLTRKISLADPAQIATIKGAIAGPVALAIGLAAGGALPGAGATIAALATGFLGYGASLVLFILALRHLGTARAGAYFSTAPFVGAAVSVPLLGEPITMALLVAGALMAYGVWLHLSERHEHDHDHPELAHEHRHSHDEHHVHPHEPGIDPREPHSHFHVHRPLRHVHGHAPDSHHRHTH